MMHASRLKALTCDEADHLSKLGSEALPDERRHVRRPVHGTSGIRSITPSFAS